MAAQKPLQLVSNRPTEVEANQASAGSGDAGKLVALRDSDGKIDESMFPPGFGADTRVIDCSEDLDAGDYINVHDSSGEKVRKADASTANAGKMAHGFVLNNYTSGTPCTVYFEGANTALTGLTPGLTYVLSNVTPGGVLALASAPTTSGHILQTLGVATASDTIESEITLQPVVRG